MVKAATEWSTSQPDIGELMVRQKSRISEQGAPQTNSSWWSKQLGVGREKATNQEGFQGSSNNEILWDWLSQASNTNSGFFCQLWDFIFFLNFISVSGEGPSKILRTGIRFKKDQVTYDPVSCTAESTPKTSHRRDSDHPLGEAQDLGLQSTWSLPDQRAEMALTTQPVPL